MVTQKMVIDWVGNNGYADKQIQWMAECLIEIANGKYTPKELKDNIESYE